MSDHDLDLITDLISGHLSPDERRAALARVAADPELQSEYETQLATASLLRAISPPAMTSAERSNLHTSLRQQLHLDDAPAPVAPAPSRWQRWWAPVTGLATAAAVVIGAVVLLPDSGTDDSLQFAAAEVTSTVQASRNDEADLGGSADSAGSIEEEEPAATGTTSEDLTPSAAVAEEGITGTLEATGAASPRSVPHVPDLDLDQLGLAYAAGGDEFEDELSKSAEIADPAEFSEVGACLDGSADAAGETSLSIVATATIEGVDVVVFSVTPSTGDSYLVALDVSTCRELASTRR